MTERDGNADLGEPKEARDRADEDEREYQTRFGPHRGSKPEHQQQRATPHQRV